MAELNRDATISSDGSAQESASRTAAKPAVSQRDYVPTPYEDSAWPVVGERVAERDFVPIRLRIFRDQMCQPDPMFEDFDFAPIRERDEIWHTSTGGWAGAARDEKQEPQFDPAVIEAELKAKFEQGRLAGREEGYKEAEEQVVARYEELSRRLEEFCKTLGDEIQLLFSRVEKRGVEFCLQVARKILVTTAEVRPEYIVEVIRRGISGLGAARPLRIRVSEQDYEFLNVIGLPPELSSEELGVQYVPDESVKSGCVIETDFGDVDMQLEKMWEQVKEQIYEVYKS